MKVTLPEGINRFSMYKLIKKIVDQDLRPKNKSISLDFSNLKFIEPVGFTVLSNLIEWLRKKDCMVEILEPSKCKYHDPSCPICFLDDSLFFERYVGKKRYEVSKPRKSSIPLSIISFHQSVQWLDETINWLASILSKQKSSLRDIHTCLGEIFNNINDHSSENTGCVFAQHYPRKNIVRIAISDFGVGIPFNVQKIHPGLNDSQAITKAIEYGFTTRSTPRNGGRGLDTLIHSVVKNNQGSVYIHSNCGILEATNDFGSIKVEERNAFGFYPGTLLEIVFRTDTIEEEEEEDFIW
ncbi:ATP-binding protein [Paenibacillus larvae]